MHVLNYVEAASGGRGLKGGLSEYARLVGKSEKRIREGRNAAKVLKDINLGVVAEVLDKAAHIATLYTLPNSTWQQAVELMLKKEWSAKETQEQVKVVWM